ncbi:MAG: RodZ domain-containing protein [Defluviicoccus sp.]
MTAAAREAGQPAAEASPRRNTVGALLRRAREERGQSVPAVARDLCMRPGYIEAIETGRLDALPTITYAVGYVRAYAAHLGFDGDRVAQRFRAETGANDQQHELSFRLPPAHGELPKAAVLLVGGLIALAAYSGWYFYASTETAVVRQVQPVPERFTAWLWKEQPAGMPAAVENAVGQAEPLPIAVAVVSPASAPAAADGQPKAVPAQADSSAPAGEADPRGTPTQASAGAFPPDRLVTSDSAGNTRIVLKARMDCWIEIKDTGSGKLIYARLLRAGDTYPVADRPGLRLLAGNAGGLDIMVDGRTLPPLGRPGAVVRNIALDPAGLSESQPAQEREG